MKTYSLNGNWDLYFFEQDSKDIKVPADLKLADVTKITATVPGNVELDLSKAGFLPEDLYMGTNIEKVQDYELHEWWYETEFEAPILDSKEKAFLKFDAVDCFATYFVNGEKIGESNNAFIEQEFEVSDVIKEGKNTLTVRIKSAQIEAWSKKNPVGTLVRTGDGRNVQFSQVRKPPHSFGWDIMPRAILGGIWRSVNLVVKSEIEFEQLFGYSEWAGGVWKLQTCYELMAPPSKDLVFEVIAKNGDFEVS